LRNLGFGRVTYEAFGPVKFAVKSVDVAHGFGSGSIVTRRVRLGGYAVEEAVGSKGVPGAVSS